MEQGSERSRRTAIGLILHFFGVGNNSLTRKIPLMPDFNFNPQKLFNPFPLLASFLPDAAYAFRPPMTFTRTTIIAITSRIWINPPMVYAVTIPNNHNTIRITQIIQSMTSSIFSAVCLHSAETSNASRNTLSHCLSGLLI